MAWGVVAGLLAGAFWGLTFVAPLAVAPFTGFDLTFVRYASYGALSIPAVVALWRNGRLNRAMLLQAALLSAAGFVGYFVLMSIAVKLSGVAVVALIVGTLPLIIALLGNRGSGRIHGSRLVAPLFLIGAGLLIVNIDAVRHVMATAPDSLGRFALGVALIIVATALWAWYALANASGMKKRQDLSAAQWSALQGVGCLLLLPLVVVVALISGDTQWRALAADARSANFLAWGVGLGAFASGFAMWLWSIASRRLPVALCGMLIVSETVFAVIYGAIFAGRAPTIAEIAATSLLGLGVIVGVRAFSGSGETARAS